MKIGIAIATIMILGVIPLGIVSALTSWQGGVKVGIYGYLVGLLATMLSGQRIAFILVPFVTVTLTLGAVFSESILIVALLITAGTLLIPILAMRAKIRPAIITSMMVANGLSPAVIPWNQQALGTSTFYLAIAGIVLFGGLWGILLGMFFRSKIPPSQDAPPKPASPRVAWAGGIPLILGTFLIAFVVGTNFPQYRWVWILAPLFSMMLAKGIGPTNAVRDLMFGTLVGTGLAVILIQVPLPMMLELMFGMLLLSASIGMNMAGMKYWIGASVSTAGVIVLTGAGMDPTLAAESRLLFGLFGGILALIVGGIAIAGIRWAGKSDQTEEKAEVPAVN